MTIFSAAALTFAMAVPAMAQGPNLHGTAAEADRQFFDSHPNVERALEKDPTLIDNQAWVDQHPALHEYLKTHPYLRHEFKSHPYDFMHSAEHAQKHPGVYFGHPGPISNPPPPVPYHPAPGPNHPVPPPNYHN